MSFGRDTKIEVESQKLCEKMTLHEDCEKRKRTLFADVEGYTERIHRLFVCCIIHESITQQWQLGSLLSSPC
jgi:hypothetical protein